MRGNAVLSIEEIQRQLQERIDASRQSGAYPLGLEAQLEAEFKNILETTYRGSRGLDHLEARMNMLRVAMASIAGVGGPVDSRVPGGRFVHRFMRRLMRRHTAALAQETKHAFDRVEFVLHEIEYLMKIQRSHDERLLNEVLTSVLDRLAVIDALVESVVFLESKLKNEPPEHED